MDKYDERATQVAIKLAFPEDGRVCWSHEEEIEIIADALRDASGKQ